MIPAQFSCGALAICSGSVSKAPYWSRSDVSHTAVGGVAVHAPVVQSPAFAPVFRTAMLAPCATRVLVLPAPACHTGQLFLPPRRTPTGHMHGRAHSLSSLYPPGIFWPPGGCAVGTRHAAGPSPRAGPLGGAEISCLKAVSFISTRARSHHSSSCCGNSASRRARGWGRGCTHWTGVGRLDRCDLCPLPHTAFGGGHNNDQTKTHPC